MVKGEASEVRRGLSRLGCLKEDLGSRGSLYYYLYNREGLEELGLGGWGQESHQSPRRRHRATGGHCEFLCALNMSERHPVTLDACIRCIYCLGDLARVEVGS